MINDTWGPQRGWSKQSATGRILMTNFQTFFWVTWKKKQKQEVERRTNLLHGPFILIHLGAITCAHIPPICIGMVWIAAHPAVSSLTPMFVCRDSYKTKLLTAVPSQLTKIKKTGATADVSFCFNNVSLNCKFPMSLAASQKGYTPCSATCKWEQLRWPETR